MPIAAYCFDIVNTVGVVNFTVHGFVAIQGVGQAVSELQRNTLDQPKVEPAIASVKSVTAAASLRQVP